MCIKRDFHVPSSTSCIRSTTNIGNGLKPRGPSFSTNAFCTLVRKIVFRVKIKTGPTEVGTQESSLRRVSTNLLLTVLFFRPYIHFRAVEILLLYLASLTRCNVICWWRSCASPRFWIRSRGIKQRGQGQPPLFRIDAKSTLREISNLT